VSARCSSYFQPLLAPRTRAVRRPHAAADGRVTLHERYMTPAARGVTLFDPRVTPGHRRVTL
jgi:hypothetical protein